MTTYHFLGTEAVEASGLLGRRPEGEFTGLFVEALLTCEDWDKWDGRVGMLAELLPSWLGRRVVDVADVEIDAREREGRGVPLRGTPTISGSSVRRARNIELSSPTVNSWASAGVELALIVAVTSLVIDPGAVSVRTDTLAVLVILSELV